MLSQRWPRDARYSLYGCSENFWESLHSYAHLIFPTFFNVLLFRSIPWLCVQNLKFVPLPTPQIDLQPMWSWYPRTSQTDGRTHAQTTCDCKTAPGSASNIELSQYQLYTSLYYVISAWSLHIILKDNPCMYFTEFTRQVRGNFLTYYKNVIYL